MQLTVAPLGTAFALSEWEEAAVDEETPKPLISKEVMAAFLYDDDDERARGRRRKTLAASLRRSEMRSRPPRRPRSWPTSRMSD